MVPPLLDAIALLSMGVKIHPPRGAGIAPAASSYRPEARTTRNGGVQYASAATTSPEARVIRAFQTCRLTCVLDEPDRAVGERRR